MQSTVVLDTFECARPDPAVGPASRRTVARTHRADKQRTTDLRDFARSRGHVSAWLRRWVTTWI